MVNRFAILERHFCGLLEDIQSLSMRLYKLQLYIETEFTIILNTRTYLYPLNLKLIKSHNLPQRLFRSSQQSTLSLLLAWPDVEKTPEPFVATQSFTIGFICGEYGGKNRIRIG